MPISKPTSSPRWGEAVGSFGVVGPNETEPAAGKKDTGWVASEEPPAGYFNWWMRLVWDWIQYLGASIFTADAGSGLDGAKGTGDGAGAGLHGVGSAAGSPGLLGAGTGNSPGSSVTGAGSGAGVQATGGASGPGISATPGGGVAPVRGAIAIGESPATPSGPQNGDIWTDAQQMHNLFARLNGSTRLVQSNIRTSPAFGAAVTISTQQFTEFKIVANSGIAFTISTPNGSVEGLRITIHVSNTSGGALGAVTWGAGYKMSAWTSPATGSRRSIDFIYDGVNWLEVSRTPADVPN